MEAISPTRPLGRRCGLNTDGKIEKLTFEACRRAGIVAVSARQLKPIEKLMMNLITKSQIELGQARY